MAEAAKARYTVEVSWSANALSQFLIGTSQVGGTDTFGGGGLFDPSFTGPYDDVSTMLQRATIGRGRDDRLTFLQAGEATVTLRDPDGLLNVRNSRSPLQSVLDDRLHPIRIASRDPLFPGFESLFVGYVRRVLWQPEGRKGIAQLECVDAFYWLERVRPIIGGGGLTTTGAAIHQILDAVGFPDSYRSIATGDTIPSFSADGSDTALDLIAGLLEAERGVFYFSRSGTATFESRHARMARRTPLYTVTNDLKGADPSVDVGLTRNRVRVQRLQSGYVATANDYDSQDRIGIADLPQIDTPYLSADSQADALANWVLGQVRQPRPPMYAMQIDNRDQDLLTMIRNLELVDRIRVKAYQAAPVGPLMDDEYFTERLEHSIELGGRYRHNLSALLSLASEQRAPFTIGVSTFPAVLYNLIANPSFEENITDGWTAVDQGAPSMLAIPDPNPSHAAFGEGSVLINQTTAGQDDFLETLITGLNPSSYYTCSAYVDATHFQAAAVSNRGLHVYDDDNPGGTVQTAQITAPSAGYIRLAVTVLTTATGIPHTLRLRLYAPQGYVHWDAVQVEPGQAAGPYFDGSMPGCAWAGTPHNSQSYQIQAGDVLAY